MNEFLHANPRRLQELVAISPLAATRCFHWTVRLVIRTLFNCAYTPGVHQDNVAAHELPGIFGYVRAYFGVVEPQMRKALHVRMIVQLLGFSHHRDIIGRDMPPDTFRRLWYFVASISFRSTEAFADYLKDPAAIAALAQLPLLHLTNKQRGMIGAQRVNESYDAQVIARGLDERLPRSCEKEALSYVPSTAHGDPGVSSAQWSTQMVSIVLVATRKTGNHVCRPDVCHKGHIGKKGLCRMMYWHWCRLMDP